MNSYDCLLISLQTPQYYIKQPLQKYCSATFLRQSHIKVICLYTLYSSLLYLLLFIKKMRCVLTFSLYQFSKANWQIPPTV